MSAQPLPAYALAALLALAGCAGPAKTHPETAPKPLETPATPKTQAVPLEDQILYFAMIDRFHDGDKNNLPDVNREDKGAWQGGDLPGLLEKLDHLQSLGITTLWISPLADQVNTPVTGAGFPDWGYHGYWAEDFTRIDPHLGTEEDLQKLLHEAHKRQIRVILDVVINHAGYNAPIAHNHTMTRPCNPNNPNNPSHETSNDLNRCLFGLPDFRTEDPAVRAQLLQWTLSWVERFPFDGFRLDTFKHVEPEAFAELHQRAEQIARERHKLPDFLVLGERWGTLPGDPDLQPLLQMGSADTFFDFGFHGLAEGFLTGRMRAEAFAHHLETRHRADGPPLVHFLDTHDVDTFAHRLGEHGDDAYVAAAALLMTTRGVPLLTWGNEVAKLGGPWPHNRQFMPWEALQSPRGKAIQKRWKDLIMLRRSAPALRGRAFGQIASHTNPNTGDAALIYRRGKALENLAPGEESFLIVLSRGTQDHTLSWEQRLPKNRELHLEPAFEHPHATRWTRQETPAGLSLTATLSGTSVSIWRATVQ